MTMIIMRKEEDYDVDRDDQIDWYLQYFQQVKLLYNHSMSFCSTSLFSYT